MSTNKRSSTAEAINMAVALILSIAGVVIAIRGALIGNAPILRTICIIAGFVLVNCYLFFGYKKPHGNLLRYAMLGFVVLLILGSLTDYTRGMDNIANAIVNGTLVKRGGAEYTPATLNICRAIEATTTSLAIMLISYLSGRLHKLEKNKVLFVAILVVMIARALSYVRSTPILIDHLSETFMWLTLALSYFFRYDEHREAGLAHDNKEY